MDVEILKITAADLDENGFYIGKADVPNFAGHIEIAADLGWVRFKAALRAAGYIRALAGSGIEAGWGIEAGLGIEAGSGIEAGLSISAKWVSTPLRVFAGLCIWRRPKPEEMEIRAEVRSGDVAYGVVVPPAAEAASAA